MATTDDSAIKLSSFCLAWRRATANLSLERRLAARAKLIVEFHERLFTEVTSGPDIVVNLQD